jgi:selenocysteine lyase/cysteine desulfurase
VTKNLLQWFAAEDGVVALTVNVTLPIVSDEVSFLAPLRALLDAHPDTRLLIFSHVVSSPGIVQPAEAIVRLCRERGVPVLIDGAHAPGLVPVALDALDADYYVGNCHKWLYSAKGSAFLWVNPRHQAAVVPTVVSSEFDPVDYIRRFLYVGTRDYCPLLSVAAALDYRDYLGGDAAVKTYLSDLAWWAGTHLRDRWNTTLLAPRAYYAAMIDVRLPLPSLADAQALQAWLYATEGIYIVVMEHNGAPYTRLSAQVFLEQADFVELGDLVAAYALQPRRPAILHPAPATP